jgi:hypothetical protein
VTSAPATVAWYVFGAAAAGAALDEAAAGLVDAGVEVEVVVERSLAAIAGLVPLAEFAEEAIAERLNDREWLEARARAHEDVLQAVAAKTAVVPFRFGTVYRGLPEVRGLLAARREELEAALERVRGRVELGVKLWLDRARLEAALGGDDTDAVATTGAAYLQRRSRERKLAEQAAARRAELAALAHERLLAHAVDGVANRPQPRELTGRSEEMLLNAAYLVAAGDRSLHEEVARLAGEHAPLGVVYELTGPWPPHNFVGDGGASS